MLEAAENGEDYDAVHLDSRRSKTARLRDGWDPFDQELCKTQVSIDMNMMMEMLCISIYYLFV